jgi:hypothetical protein
MEERPGKIIEGAPSEYQFPTSARPIFVRTALLVAVIAGLFVIVYLDREAKPSKPPAKKKSAVSAPR